MHTKYDLLRLVKIEEIKEETPTVKTLFFKDKRSDMAKPAQFLMVWIPRKEEIPLSIMISDKKSYAGVTIRKRGYASSSLYSMQVGDYIGIRGPYGNYFTTNDSQKSLLLIGGGTGLVPLIRLLQSLITRQDIKITLIMGSKTKNEIFFDEVAERLLENKKHQILISTEDGSYGRKGFVTDILNELLTKESEKFDTVYTCGPEVMMKQIHLMLRKKNIHLQASLERYMKCGIGICSSCCINDKLVCIDGTVFNEEQLSGLSEFGNGYRNKSGQSCKYE